jgi:PAS domain S-box-containing protein
MAYLEILSGDHVGQCVDLTDDVRIGRHINNDICLTHSAASRYHARIFRDGPRFVLEDLHSHNGTELCGMRLPPNTPRELTTGDVITIGHNRLRFHATTDIIVRDRPPEALEPSVVAPPVAVRGASESSPHTRALQLFDEELTSPRIVVTRDASINLRQIITHQPQTPEEIQQIYRRLQAICQINVTLGTTTGFAAMMEILLDCLLEIYPKAERAFILLSTPGHSDLIPFATKTRHTTSIDPDDPALSQTIINMVRTQKCAILSHDTHEDPRFNTQESVIVHGIRSLICAPILVDDEFFGVIQLDSCKSMMAFSSDDLEILTAIVAQVELTIKQARLVVNLESEIVQRREAESILNKSELHYRSLTEAVPVGVYRADINGLYLYTNELWSKITGLVATKAFGLGWTKALHADDRERICSKWAAAVQSQQSFQAEYRFHHEDGVIKWVYGQVVTEKTEEGSVSGYVGTITDITERKKVEEEREQLQQQLINFSRQAGMAELATGVLHNVGNVLNSINVSATVLAEQLKKNSVDSLAKASDLIQHHVADLGHFVVEDERGKHFPQFLHQLVNKLKSEQVTWTTELEAMTRNINHIKEIVNLQQSYARVSSIKEEVLLETLAEDALRAIDVSMLHHDIELVREFEPIAPLLTDKHKVLQILVNLLSNAKQALRDSALVERRLIVRIFQPTGNRIAVEVADTGVGISKSHLPRIFEHGFTTKPDGHGFGLHSCGLMAKELGGELTVHSEGLGGGATFRLELPL